jgi:hypothetical protein
MTPTDSSKYDSQYTAAPAKGTRTGSYLANCVDLEGDRALHKIHHRAVRCTREVAIGDTEQRFFLIRAFQAAANKVYFESKARVAQASPLNQECVSNETTDAEIESN